MARMGNFEHIAPNGNSIGAALLGYAKRDESDLLVVGAYSHARAREIISNSMLDILVTNDVSSTDHFANRVRSPYRRNGEAHL